MSSPSSSSSSSSSPSSPQVPLPPLLSPFGCYPNPLNVTEEDRRTFHPVVAYPERVKRAGIPVTDHTAARTSTPTTATTTTAATTTKVELKDSSETNTTTATTLLPPFVPKQLATLEEFEALQQQQQQRRRPPYTKEELENRVRRNNDSPELDHWYRIGRYDEDRPNMYESDLFVATATTTTTTAATATTTTTTDDGGSDPPTQVQSSSQPQGQRRGSRPPRRTVHLGIDLAGPLYTPVHAFADGTVHSVGYNPPLGDYGYAVVVRHALPPPTAPQSSLSPSDESPSPRTVYALYGHLHESVVREWKAGDAVPKGSVLGYMGDVHENGGWYVPHVHLTTSIRPPPAPHDMPGTCTVRDRRRLLRIYFDPRYILGPIY